MRLLFVRHGETPWNVTLQYQGHAAIPLTPLGRSQAATVAARLASSGATALYSSDLLRAAQTAEALAVRCALPITFEPDLREIDVGDWQGLTPRELEQRFPQHMAEYYREPAATVRLNGESYVQLQQRALAAVQRITAQHQPGDRLLLVSHGGTIRTLVCHAIGLELRHFGRLWLDNASITELEWSGDRLRLIRLNDTAHFDVQTHGDLQGRDHGTRA